MQSVLWSQPDESIKLSYGLTRGLIYLQNTLPKCIGKTGFTELWKCYTRKGEFENEYHCITIVFALEYMVYNILMLWGWGHCIRIDQSFRLSVWWQEWEANKIQLPSTQLYV